MQHRKMIAAVTMSAAVLGGAVVGATVGNPLASGAQDGTATTTTTTTAPGGAPSTPGGGRHGLGLGFGIDEWLEPAATALGLTTDELRDELAAGKSLSDVAEEQGVERSTLVDALVTAGKEKLDEIEAKLPDLIDAALDAKLPDGDGFSGRGRSPGAAMGFDLDAAAEVLGLTLDDLRTALRDGTSLADLAEQKGIDQQKVIDALVAGVKSHLDQAVADGKLTQAEADERLQGATERITKLVTEGFSAGGWGHGPGNGDGSGQPGTDQPGTDAPGDDGGN